MHRSVSPAGARLHCQLLKEGDAVSVRAREEEGGADHEAARDLHNSPEGASHQPWRLPECHQDAGTGIRTDLRTANFVFVFTQVEMHAMEFF